MLTKHSCLVFAKADQICYGKKETLVKIQNQSSIDWGKFKQIDREMKTPENVGRDFQDGENRAAVIALG